MATKQVTGLSKTTPYLALGGKIKPQEIDLAFQYVVTHPSISASAIVAECSGTATAGTLTVAYMDYPRTLSMKYVEASGTAAIATATVYGKDQFGTVISEAFVNTNLGTVTVEGTKIFAYVGTVTLGGASTAAGDDVAIGYSSAGGTAQFGLPWKVGAASDVKSSLWSDNSAACKQGTCSVSTTLHAVKLAVGTISDQDTFIWLVKPSYRSDDNETGYPAGTVIT